MQWTNESDSLSRCQEMCLQTVFKRKLKSHFRRTAKKIRKPGILKSLNIKQQMDSAKNNSWRGLYDIRFSLSIQVLMPIQLSSLGKIVLRYAERKLPLRLNTGKQQVVVATCSM